MVERFTICFVFGAEVFGQAHVNPCGHRSRLPPFGLNHERRAIEPELLAQTIGERSFDRKMNLVSFIGKDDERRWTHGRLGNVVDAYIALELQSFYEPI